MIRRPPRSTQSRSSAASDVYKRQGGTPGGGSGSRSRPNFGRGNRGRGHRSGGGRGGRRDSARSRSTGYSSSFSSSSASSSDRGDVTVVTAKRQATPSLVDVASSAESLSKLAVSGDRAMPVPLRLAYARTAAFAAADAAADARHEASVRRAYVTVSYTHLTLPTIDSV